MKKRIFASLLLSSLVLTTVVTPSLALAESVDEQIEQKDKEISSLKEQQTDVAAQVAALESDITNVFNEGLELKEQQAILETKTEELKKEIEDLNIRIEKRTEAIENQARDVQVKGQGVSIIDAVLEADSISDAISRVQAITTIVKANNDLISQQKEDKESVVAKQSETEQKIQAIEDTKAELETKKQELVLKQSDLTVLKTSLQLEQTTAESSKTALLQQKADAEAEQARVVAEQKAAAEAKLVAAATKDSSDSSSTEQSSTATSESTTTSTTNESVANATTDTNQGSTGGGNTTTITGGGSGGGGATIPSGGGSTGGGSGSVSNSSDPTYLALNTLRIAHGLSPVSWDAGLAATATARAAVVNSSGIPSDHWSRGDEVIAIMWGAGSPVINAWYNETGMITASGSGHRDWELNPTMTRVGFGYVGDSIVGHSA